MTQSQMQDLEYRTWCQAAYEERRQERRKRPTASNLGKVWKTRQSPNKENSAQEVIADGYQLFAQVQVRSKKKIVPITQLEVWLQQYSLCVDIDEPGLGASHDGVIDDKFLVEVKCPSSAVKMTPQ